jgi:predicted transposase YdaD
VLKLSKAIDDMKKKAEAKGRAEGRAEARRETAVGTYVNGVPVDIILKSLNMNIDELKDILAQNNIEFNRAL